MGADSRSHKATRQETKSFSQATRDATVPAAGLDGDATGAHRQYAGAGEQVRHVERTSRDAGGGEEELQPRVGPQAQQVPRPRLLRSGEQPPYLKDPNHQEAQEGAGGEPHVPHGPWVPR